MTRERQSLNATSERDKEIGLDRRTAGRTEKKLAMAIIARVLLQRKRKTQCMLVFKIYWLHVIMANNGTYLQYLPS